MDLITVIVPCYNEEESLPLFYKEIVKVSKTMKEVSFEFLFVNDGSKDDTLNILRKLSKKDKRVRYVSFSRNFGKEAAMYAGFENSKGDYVVVMDADLQDPPSLLPEMFNYIKKEDYDFSEFKIPDLRIHYSTNRMINLLFRLNEYEFVLKFSLKLISKFPSLTHDILINIEKNIHLIVIV